MKDKKVSATLRLKLENPPEDYKSLIGETYKIGTESTLNLSTLLLVEILRTAEFYYATMGCETDYINAELEKVVDRLQKTKFIMETNRNAR